jgi:hypothetical protein
MIRSLRLRAALLLTLGAAASPLTAQTVQGELRDADRDRPLPGARLLLLDSDGVPVDSARTDRSGRYRLTASAAGEYSLYLRIDGYASVPSDPLRLAAGSTTEYAFRAPLVSVAAIREMHDVISMNARLQEALPQICGEPFRAWEAGLLVGTVRRRATSAPIPGARVSALDDAGRVVANGLAGETGVYVLCNVPTGRAVRIFIEADPLTETTDVEIRAGTASWYDLPVGPRR